MSDRRPIVSKMDLLWAFEAQLAGRAQILFRKGHNVPPPSNRVPRAEEIMHDKSIEYWYEKFDEFWQHFNDKYTFFVEPVSDGTKDNL